MIDPKEVEEALGNETEQIEYDKKESNLPEAPVSITVRGYYKGFSVLITKRNAEGEVKLEKIVEAIDNMEAKGFNPSWNEATNKGNGPQTPPQKPREVKEAQGSCPHTQFKVFQVKKEDSPNKGKWFKSCANCRKFISWTEV